MKAYISLLLIITMLGSNAVMGQDLDIYTTSTERSEVAQVYFKKGASAVVNSQFRLGVVYFDSALVLQSMNPDFLIARGQAREFVGDDIGALNDYNKAYQIHPEQLISIYKRALVYFKKEKYKQAAKDLTYLTSNLMSLNTPVIIYKGTAFNDLGDNQLFSVSTIDEILADVYAHRAMIYEQLGYKTSALLDHDKAIELNDLDPNYFVNRGVFRLDRGDKSGAIYDYRSALKINPNHKAALYNLSFLVDEEERDQINIILFGAGDKARAYSLKAFESFQKGDYKIALLNYDSALRIDADNASDLMNRGLVKTKMKDYKGAIKDFNSSVYSDNSLLRNYVFIGDSYLEQEDYNYAIKYYDRYLANAGPDGKIYYNIGVAYMKFSKNDEACTNFRKAIELGEERAEEPMDDVCF